MEEYTHVYFGGLIPVRQAINSPKGRSNSLAKLFSSEPDEEKIKKKFDDADGYYFSGIGDHIDYRYEIYKILGKGSFAQVIECIDHGSKGEHVAIKITRNTDMDHKFANAEGKILAYLMENDTKNAHNIVRMHRQFTFRSHHCFVFELLKTDLFEHLKDTNFSGFSVDKIRGYAEQILKSLVYLEKHHIIHCDLKPENILICDKDFKKVKLADYGSGCFVNEQMYTYVQSRFYRAPEIVLRIRYTEKVDIWSLGCILAELYTGEPIFPGNNE